jgi:hypothetical protein
MATPAPGVGAVVWQAVRSNLLPGLFLWTLLGLFLISYSLSAVVQAGMARWADVKLAVGPVFAALSYTVFAVWVPEALGWWARRPRLDARFWHHLLFASVMWGAIGWSVDVFYRVQNHVFGLGHDWLTVLQKTAVDQFLFGPLMTLLSMLLLKWRDDGYPRSTWAALLDADFWRRLYLPVMVALWCVWLPTIAVLYSLPAALQFPVVSVVTSFWMLIFTFLRKG